MSILAQHNAEVLAMCSHLGKVNNKDPRQYLEQIEGAYAEALKVRAKNLFVLVPESAISPVREKGEE